VGCSCHELRLCSAAAVQPILPQLGFRLFLENFISLTSLDMCCVLRAHAASGASATAIAFNFAPSVFGNDAAVASSSAAGAASSAEGDAQPDVSSPSLPLVFVYRPVAQVPPSLPFRTRSEALHKAALDHQVHALSSETKDNKESMK
jgi:hypothetical protein